MLHTCSTVVHVHGIPWSTGSNCSFCGYFRRLELARKQAILSLLSGLADVQCAAEEKSAWLRPQKATKHLLCRKAGRQWDADMWSCSSGSVSQRLLNLRIAYVFMLYLLSNIYTARE